MSAILLLLLLGAQGARAGGVPVLSGLYVGFGGTYSADLFEDEIEDAVDLPVDVDDSFGVNARVGYRLLPFLAAELEYEWVDEYSISILGVDSLDLEVQALTANMRLIAPVWRIQPYFLAGVGGVEYDVRDRLGLGLSESRTALAGRLGGGVELYLTDHLALDAGANVVLTTQDFDVPGADDVDNLYYVSTRAGLLWRF